ncbi:type I methionyl aminopeptidase [Halodesulfovibrio spirochaetisodalis]|uniref:Methionine aminopeptidase n=1 Tax=Halodesulfovibrio spirochaetisodalis TaxID=1560234 RepID=A0A1B7XQ01_9BACT|nr:type I methionyl aminopeptidase [Halodesulfovibrio spirochaetisodalis]OBQ57591.1 methionine aminopeptidase [Halodesulfovibrio spirochaetisodalis]
MKKYRGVFLKNEKEIGLLREANRIGAIILDVLGEHVRPGVKTIFFHELTMNLCKQFNVKPAFLGLYGFPYSLCCSVNEEIVHGFPSDRVLKEGDIVSFDVGVLYEGFYGDNARTFTVGTVSEKAQKLVDVTRESLMLGIEQARPGNNLNDVSRAIQEHAEAHGFGIVRRFVGHGIGRKLHEKPEVPNFVPHESAGLPLKAGMVIAIEPMVTEGSYEVDILDDNWTAVTKDRKLSAHFEHSIAITSDGPVILSLSD